TPGLQGFVEGQERQHFRRDRDHVHAARNTEGQTYYRDGDRKQDGIHLTGQDERRDRNGEVDPGAGDLAHPISGLSKVTDRPLSSTSTRARPSEWRDRIQA